MSTTHLPADPEEWIALYRSGRWRKQRMGDGHRVYPATRMVLEGLWKLMAGGVVSVGYRGMGERWGVSAGTVQRIVERLVILGAIEKSGGDWHPAKPGERAYRDPLSLRAVWPPDPSIPIGER